MYVGVSLQRLFSTFASGWPGKGLALQRVITASALVYCAVVCLLVPSPHWLIAAHMIAAGAGALVLVGLWTPVAGAVVAGSELWIVLLSKGNPWMALLLATLGGTLAMIGPGAWSIDARLFGRKRIET